MSEREWWQPPHPMGSLLGSGVRGAGLSRPAIPQPLPPEPPPAPKAERAVRRVPPVAPVEAVPTVPKPLGASGMFVRSAPPEIAPGKVLEASTPATREPAEPVALRPAPSGIQPGTIRGVILRAACELAAGSTLTRIALAAVVVRAWRLDTARLGLRGYEQTHPDANRVYAKLSGTEGLVELGLLERTGFGVVSVTRKGLAWWRRVMP